jgi:DNA-binding CsgD family transcriptional regulator
LLSALRTVAPGSSLSVYRTGAGARPQRYMGASHRQPDTTRACWRAYMSGPYLRDASLTASSSLAPSVPTVCHVSACEVQAEHRSKVYEAYGMAERVSVVCREDDGALFAVNLYRHTDQPAFSDTQLSDFAELAPTVLLTTRKHLALLGRLEGPRGERPRPDAASVRGALVALQPRLTRRELDVCERLLQGLTDEGVAADLSLGLPTVRTYRNRAFIRLGIHFRSELFALLRRHGG